MFILAFTITYAKPKKPLKEIYGRGSVTGGETLFGPLLEAATKFKVSSAAIINWIRSPKTSWEYAS